MNPGPDVDIVRLPAARRRDEALVPFQIAAVATPDEARRFVAVVSQERAVIGALKFERNGFNCAHFIAKILNRSDDMLSCTIAGWAAGKPIYLAQGSFWINPQSVVQIPVRVPLRFPQRIQALSLHLQAPTVRATAEADVPAPLLTRLFRAVAGVAAFVAASMATWHGVRPQIDAYALPARVAAGDLATASYSVSGLGSARYDVTSHGARVAGGSLDGRTGTFSFPTSKNLSNYHVVLSITGFLGTARRDLIVNAVPSHERQMAAIEALQPEPSVIHGGGNIHVRYIADARSGTVTLYDASGIVLARSPYSPSGVSSLPAPNVATPTQYRVALNVVQGSSTAQASAGLLVLPKSGKNPLANPTPIPGVLTPAQVFRIDSSFVASERPFTVRVLSHPQNLHLTIEDQHGGKIADARVAAGQNTVRFTAPHVDESTPYVIVATFSRGNADQTLLQPLVVHAAQ